VTNLFGTSGITHFWQQVLGMGETGACHWSASLHGFMSVSFSSATDFQNRWRVEYIPLNYMDASQFKVYLKV
jgi:hypothetical protein